jgi:hypothetical protein
MIAPDEPSCPHVLETVGEPTAPGVCVGFAGPGRASTASDGEEGGCAGKTGKE